MEDNLLTKLPREIGWLGKTLRSLLIARNKIVRLPGEIAFLNPTVKLSLDGNPLVVCIIFIIYSFSFCIKLSYNSF